VIWYIYSLSCCSAAFPLLLNETIMKSKHLALLVLALLFLCCKKDKDTKGQTVNKPDTVKAEKQIQLLLNQYHIPGIAVAVTDEKEILWQRTAGIADKERQVAVSPHTVFKLGSLAKPFIAISVMKLVEAGKLDLDKPVNDYLDFEVRNPRNPGKQITLRHLLTHTSGIADSIYASLLVSEFFAPGSDHPMQLKHFIRNMLSRDGAYYETASFVDDSNGPQYNYSNVGASLTAYIAERVSGLSFDAFTEKSIFHPLSLQTVKWHLKDFSLPLLAMPYNESTQPYGAYTIADYPSGGLHGSIGDICRIMQLLINKGTLDGKTIITPVSLDAIQSVPYPLANPHQGLFMENVSFAGVAVYGHNGTVPGSNAFMYYSPEKKRGVVVVVNADIDGAVAGEINHLIMALFNM
jgi:CubicO group peptidase (beta-lactamase class C family)